MACQIRTVNHDNLANWVKVALCIHYVKYGIEEIVSSVSRALYEKHLKNLRCTSKTCKNRLWERWDEKRREYVGDCQACCNFSNAIFKRLRKQPKPQKKPQFNGQKDNVNFKKCMTSVDGHWEVAKYFMNLGLWKKSSVQETDTSNIIWFILRCDEFNVPPRRMEQLEDLIKIRNSCFHSGSLEQTTTKLVKCKNLAVDLLDKFFKQREPPEHSGKCESAVSEINKVFDCKLVNLTQSSTVDALNDLTSELEYRKASGKITTNEEMLLTGLPESIKLIEENGNCKIEQIGQIVGGLKQNKEQRFSRGEAKLDDMIENVKSYVPRQEVALFNVESKQNLSELHHKFKDDLKLSVQQSKKGMEVVLYEPSQNFNDNTTSQAPNQATTSYEATPQFNEITNGQTVGRNTQDEKVPEPIHHDQPNGPQTSNQAIMNVENLDLHPQGKGASVPIAIDPTNRPQTSTVEKLNIEVLLFEIAAQLTDDDSLQLAAYLYLGIGCYCKHQEKLKLDRNFAMLLDFWHGKLDVSEDEGLNTLLRVLGMIGREDLKLKFPPYYTSLNAMSSSGSDQPQSGSHQFSQSPYKIVTDIRIVELALKLRGAYSDLSMYLGVPVERLNGYDNDHTTVLKKAIFMLYDWRNRWPAYNLNLHQEELKMCEKLKEGLRKICKEHLSKEVINTWL